MINILLILLERGAETLIYKEDSGSGLSCCPGGHLYSHRRHGQLCPYCFLVLEGDTSSIPKNKKLIPPKPVVGWLVCLSGTSQGKDYRIVMEKNFIGSADNMHIRILGDKQIKERNHGFIAFDPLNKKMTLVPQLGLMLLKHKVILEPTELNDGDIITIGGSLFKLIFPRKLWEIWLGEERTARNKPIVKEFITPLKPGEAKLPDEDKKESDLSPAAVDTLEHEDDSDADEGSNADVDNADVDEEGFNFPVLEENH